MKIEEFSRAVRALSQIYLDDKAVVIAIRRKNGQVVTINTGDKESRQVLYKVLRTVPPSSPQIKATVREEGEE